MNKVAQLKKTEAYKLASRGQKTRMTTELKYGENFHAKIGKKGGEIKNDNKGFGSATSEQLAAWGRKGGQKSRKNRKLQDVQVDYI